MIARKMTEIQPRKKDKNQHIQVFVRVRPPSREECHGKSPTVVEVASPREVIVRERPQDSKHTKKFTFDRVFGPTSKQLDVYTSVVSPLLDEVLAGYNCTVFAYGQTGTGKTFTMEGEFNDPSVHWQSDTAAGIIPRSLNHLFDELRLLEAQEYTVKVSFLELYNEELFDLLSSTDDASKIRLYEDTTKKGAVIIHGLEEVTVHNKTEVYKILEKGSEKRQTAATLMNAHSSRSHTVFSITIHIKENTVEGEELLKTGKLNLVDLAGSENVGRSGAVDRRAREAGNINQSLLTLGRVITALVERAPHIPYRESKLTRLLQESLGGRTKTSIIATISSAALNLEETLSTLDYAYRAKNITNRPEVNQKLSKKALLKEYTEEIERLRRDLQATRDRNGVYLAHDNYNEMQSTIEFQGKEIEEKINHIKALEETMAQKEKLLDELKISLDVTQKKVAVTEQERNEQKFLVETHLINERKLLEQANELLNVVELATDDTVKLREKIDRKMRIESENDNLSEKFRRNIDNQFASVDRNLTSYTQKIVQFLLTSKDEIDKLCEINSRSINDSIKLISGDLLINQREVMEKIEINVNSNHNYYDNSLDNLLKDLLSRKNENSELQRDIFNEISLKIDELVDNRVSDNLRKINELNKLKFDNLNDFMMKTIDTVCNKLLNDRKDIVERINIYADRINETIEAQKALSIRKEKFDNCFNKLFNDYQSIYDEELMVNDTILTVSEEGLEFCKNIDDKLTKNAKVQEEIKGFINNDLSSKISEIAAELSSDLGTNWNICDDAVKRGGIVRGELAKRVDDNCEKMEKRNDEIVTRSEELRERMEADRSGMLSSLREVNKIVSDASVNHEEFLSAHSQRMEKICGEICRKFEATSVETGEWNTGILGQAGGIKHQIDKFIVEDMRKDVPTGSTPAKREFNYPKSFVITSPHERIIQRFRQMKSYHEDSQDEDTIIFSPDETIKASDHSLTIDAKKDRDSANGLIKSASTSDLSSITRNLSKEIMRSVSDVNEKRENKENGNYNFLKPGEFKNGKISKLRHPTREILSSYNK